MINIYTYNLFFYKYVNILYHYHVVQVARISLTLSRHIHIIYILFCIYTNKYIIYILYI